MIPISAAIITYNEEENIERTVKSLDFCDEVVIVDSGSSDHTVELCTQLQCKIIHRPFDNFGLQKRFAVEQTKNDWVLVIDADEVITAELKKEIVSHFSDKEVLVQGFYLPRTLVFLDHIFLSSGQHKQPYLRLFNKKFGTFNFHPLHAGVELNGTTASLKHLLLHYSYHSLEDYLNKFNRYTTIAARHLVEQGKKNSKLKTVLRFPLTFIKIYLLKAGFMDGYAGLMWTLLSSMYPVIKYAKFLEYDELNKAS